MSIKSEIAAMYYLAKVKPKMYKLISNRMFVTLKTYEKYSTMGRSEHKRWVKFHRTWRGKWYEA